MTPRFYDTGEMKASQASEAEAERAKAEEREILGTLVRKTQRGREEVRQGLCDQMLKWDCGP